MPTEREMREAGPLSPDDPAVQEALTRMSRGMQRGVVRLVEVEKETHAAARAHVARDPEHPPPEHKKGPAPRPEGAGPRSSSTVSTPSPKGEGADAYF